MNDFVGLTTDGQISLPIESEEEFYKFLYTFIEATEVGQDYVKSQALGFDLNTGKLKFMKISARSIGDADISRHDKLPIREGWDNYVEEFIV